MRALTSGSVVEASLNSTLLIPFDWTQLPVSSMHYCSIHDQSSPFFFLFFSFFFFSFFVWGKGGIPILHVTPIFIPPPRLPLYIARAAHDRAISSSIRPVFYRSRVPFPLFVRSLLVVTHGRGTSIRLGYLLSHRSSRCLRILHFTHASWPVALD